MEQRKKDLTITRIFDAPRHEVWQACKEPSEFKKWWGQPKDAVMPVCEIDFRMGGSFHCKVELPDGNMIWIKGVYKEIVEETKLVIENYFSDEKGALLETPDLEASLVTLVLEDAGSQTKLTVRHEGLGSEIHKVEQYEQGWSESLDRLAEVLTNNHN